MDRMQLTDGDQRQTGTEGKHRTPKRRMVQTSCPGCGGWLRYPKVVGAIKAVCPSCGQTVVIDSDRAQLQARTPDKLRRCTKCGSIHVKEERSKSGSVLGNNVPEEAGVLLAIGSAYYHLFYLALAFFAAGLILGELADRLTFLQRMSTVLRCTSCKYTEPL